MIDLELLLKKLDEALAKETKESFWQWYDEHEYDPNGIELIEE